MNDDITLLDVALRQYGARRRLTLALAASVILNAVLIGWLWSMVIAP